MSANRANWFEAFESVVQFYPRLASSIALGAMATAAGIIGGSRRDASAALAEAVPPVSISEPQTKRKRTISRSVSTARTTPKQRGRRKKRVGG